MNALRRLAFGVGVGVVFGIAASAFAGDLNPPPGPVMPTDDVVLNAQAITLPYAITQPGAYRLTSNLFAGAAGPNGIEIYVDNVWLDLGGFVLDGGPVGVPGGDGIVAMNPVQNITILNGTVTSWGDDGIDLSFATHSRIKNVTVSRNTTNGVWGPTIELVDCIAKENGQSGIEVFDHSIVVRCTATDNGINSGFGNGITAFDHCKVANCVSRGNQGDGFDATFQCVIVDCVASFNQGTGILAGEHTKVADCVAGGNRDGIAAFIGGVVVDCVATENANTGIFGDIGCVITNCKASRNIDGFVGIAGAKIVECSATENIQFGFYVDAGATVRHCNASLNALGGGPIGPGAGIYAENECMIECNHVWLTQGQATAGIEVNGIGNRVSNNDSKSNFDNYRFNAPATGNTLFGNSATLPLSGPAGNYVIIGFANDIAPITSAAFGASRLDNIIY